MPDPIRDAIEVCRFARVAVHSRSAHMTFLRLANWDARTLLKLAWTGLPVMVEE